MNETSLKIWQACIFKIEKLSENGFESFTPKDRHTFSCLVVGASLAAMEWSAEVADQLADRISEYILNHGK